MVSYSFLSLVERRRLLQRTCGSYERKEIDMATNSDFVSFVKEHVFPIALPLVSVVSLLLGVLELVDKQRAGLVLLLSGFGSAVLILYNVWIANAKKEPKVIQIGEPAAPQPRFSKRSRICRHVASGCVLAIYWVILFCMIPDKRAGYVLFGFKRYSLASKRLGAYLKDSSDDFGAQYKLAVCYDKLGKSQMCIDKLESLIWEDPNKVSPPNEHLLDSLAARDVYYQLAQCYKKRSQIEEYIKALEDLVDLLAERRILRRSGAEEIEAMMRAIHQELVVTLVSCDYGIPDQDRILERHLRSARDPNSPLPAEFWIQGLLAARRAAEGTSELAAAIEIQKYFSEAKATIDGLNLSPHRYRSYMSQHYCWLGQALSELGYYHDARQELERGLEIAKNDNSLASSVNEFYFYLGRNEYRKTGEIRDAQIYWDQIPRRTWYYASAQLITGFYHLCRAVEVPKDGNQPKPELEESLKAAEEAFREAGFGSEGERDAFQTAALSLRLGQLHLEQENYLEAARQFQKACDKNPSYYLPFYWLGRVMMQEQKFDNAEKAMRQAEALEPKNTYIYYWLVPFLKS